MTALFTASLDPIRDIEFSGLHWIEASAGSGKTFTLSSLIVRALVEKYLPRQVIATTFTRAAAAELKVRIRARLVEVRQFFEKRRGHLEADNLHLAAELQRTGDPLYAVLLQKFAHQVGYACERLKLVLDQLDELVVGTLDSFSQKLLKDFAFESGKIEPAEITDQAKTYVEQLIHDVLRAWLNDQSQQTIDWLYFSGALKPTTSYLGVVETALNFTAARFKVPEPQALDFEQLRELQRQAAGLSFDHLSAYYSADGDFFPFVSGTYFKPKDKFTTLFTVLIPEAIQALLDGDGKAFFARPLSDARERIYKLSELIENQKLFTKKCPANAIDAFYQDTTLTQWRQLVRHLYAIEQTLQQSESYLKYHLCQEVKRRLPERLKQHGETTFSEQIRTLAEALQGEQGQLFSAFVHRSYPLIFVDEFQDTNQDQDNMLATIWRDVTRYGDGCMVMVGDRKQAIYGFRGGDMLTFIRAYHDVFAKQGHLYRLKYNHRTVRPLVEAVDALFQRQPDFGEGVIYEPVEAGTRLHPNLMDEQGANHLPLRWLEINNDISFEIQVAWKISVLLQQAQRGQLYLEHKAEHHPVVADDIAVLSRNHTALDQVQYELERLGIRVNRPAKRSVFDSPIAKDVAAVLTAMLFPYDETYIRRALLSRLLGFKLSDLQELEQHADGLGQYIGVFNDMRELWFERNFLTAWHALVDHFHVWANLVRYQSRDNERVVVNLRHLTDLLSQYSAQYQGPQNLYQWYLKQLTSPSTREWELERRLSTAAGVQLMTIHQSKGLEFKIVFILEADKVSEDRQPTLNFSTQQVENTQTQQLESQRVIAIYDKQQLNEDEVSQHQLRTQAEQYRLYYVALTRASHRIYAVLTQPKSKVGVNYWRHQEHVFAHPACGFETIMDSAPERYQEIRTEAVTLYAKPQPRLRLYPRLKTSFTGLAQHLTRQQALDFMAQTLDITAPADDEQVQDPIQRFEPINEKQHPILDIARDFPMGVQAGNFLHEIFEHIDFQNNAEWGTEVYRRFKNDYHALKQQLSETYQKRITYTSAEILDEQVINAVQYWLSQVLAQPLHDHFCLNQLPQNSYLSEFSFYLAMADHIFSSQRIYKLFEEYQIYIPALNTAESARFLNGSIDLVYVYDGKYYIADYKSNFLGEDLEDYSKEAIAQNMSQSSYWLQASLYLVVLHRYLKQRLRNYDISHHLGGASYLYLRGMGGDPNYGVYHWQPSVEFIARLDAILGYYGK